jgi:hypothetical protein
MQTAILTQLPLAVRNIGALKLSSERPGSFLPPAGLARRDWQCPGGCCYDHSVLMRR